MVAPGRSQAALTEIRKFATSADSQKRLLTLVAEVSTQAGATSALKVAFEQVGEQLDRLHIVASIGGGWREGAISSTSIEQFQKVYKDLVESQYVFALATLPEWERQLQKQGAAPGSPTYTFITGSAAEEGSTQTSLMNLGAAGCVSLAAQFKEEWKEKAVRVNEYRIAMRVVKNPTQPWENDHKIIGDALIGVINGNYRNQTLRASSLADIDKHRAGF